MLATPERWVALYHEVSMGRTDLRSMLEALVGAAHRGADPDDVRAVRSLLFQTHDRGRALLKSDAAVGNPEEVRDNAPDLP